MYQGLVKKLDFYPNLQAKDLYHQYQKLIWEKQVSTIQQIIPQPQDHESKKFQKITIN